MTAQQPPVPIASSMPPGAPYVGLRPFREQERSLFFGRKNETAVIVNKILANPLSVMFAASGIGKTSILKASVVPELRKLEAKVIYFDEWSSDPVASLRKTIQQATQSATPSDGTLLDLVRAANRQSGDSLVLILDQFEQFFVRCGEASEAFNEELGALVRSGTDAQVVVVLREEYLALLHTLRGYWLTVPPARYRLEPLSQEGAREAIEKPLANFDGSIESALVDELLGSLSLGSATTGLAEEAGRSNGVSLPILQIVCKSLWNAVADTPGHHITMALYAAYGGRKGIVDGYVREVLSDATPRERVDMARVLNLLAPKAGVKMAYPIEVLSDQVQVPHAELLELLGHFQRHHIVRFREAGTVAELTHDAFTEVLRSFIDDEIYKEEARRAAEELAEERRRQLKLLMNVVFITVLAVCLGIGYNLWKEWSAQRAALVGADCAHMLTAVRYFRGSDERPWHSYALARLLGLGPLDELSALEGNSAARTCNAPHTFAGDIEKAGTPASISIAFRGTEEGSSRPIQIETVRRLWHRLSDTLWRESRIRIPAQIDAVLDPSLTAGTFVVRVGRRGMTIRPMPPLGDRIAVLALNAPQDLEREVTPVGDAVHLLKRPLARLDDRSVFAAFADAWSSPLWRVIEERAAAMAAPGGEPFTLEIFPALEAGMVFDALDFITGEPEVYLTESLTRELLELRGQRQPCLLHSVALRSSACLREAHPPTESCRESTRHRVVARVQSALVEAAREGRASGMLTRVLDRMADLEASDPTAVDPRTLAKWVVDDANVGKAPGEIRLSGAGNRGCPRLFADSSQASDTARALDEEEQPLRLRFGPTLAMSMTRNSPTPANSAQNLQASPELTTLLRSLRAALYQSRGLILPDPSLTRSRWEGEGSSVDVAGSSGIPTAIEDASAMGRAIESRVREMPAAWVTADDQRSLPAGLRGWIENTFSANDVKLLLRGVLLAQPAGAEATLIDLPWLMGSLPVWSSTCEPHDGGCLVKALLETQRSRMTKAATGTTRGPAMSAVVTAVIEDRPADAQRAFVAAHKRQPDAARGEFLAAYAAAANDFLTRRVRQYCDPPEPGAPWRSLTTQELLETHLLERADAKEEMLAIVLRHCTLIGRLPSGNAAADALELESFLTRGELEIERWSSAQKYWVAYHLMDASLRVAASRKRSTISADARHTISRLLDAVFSTNPPYAGQAFEQLLGRCEEHGDESCVWELANVAKHSRLDQGPLVRLASTLFGLASLNTKARLQDANDVLTRIEAELPREFRYLLNPWRLASNVSLLSHGVGDADQVVAQIEQLLSTSYHSSSADLSFAGPYFVALEHAGRFDDATKLALEHADDVQHEPRQRLLAIEWKFRLGRVQEAAAAADLLLEDLSGSPDEEGLQKEVLFIAALSHLLLDDDKSLRLARRFLLWADHPYRDYVLLMLSSRLKERQQGERMMELLQERLREVPSEEAEEERLAAGDLSPWRERLVRYYLEPSEANHSKVFGSLGDARDFEKSALVGGAQAYAVFRCEAFFYDALLQRVTGEVPTRHDRYTRQLREVTEDTCFGTYEMVMARWLLARAREASGGSAALPP